MTDVLILIDMDGVVCDFDEKFYELCAFREYVMHGGAVSAVNPCTEHRFATHCIDDRKQRSSALRFVESPGWFRNLKPIEGAIDGLHKLLERDDSDVFLCTKPMTKNPTCRDEKAEWVRQHLGSKWLDRLIIAPDKGMVRGDVLLDDAPKSQWFDRAEWEPVIFPTAWNGPESQLAAREGIEDYMRWSWTDGVDRLVEYAAACKDART